MSDVIRDKLDVSRETFARFEAYVALLEKWNPKINLVAKSTLADVWTRHILDSLQVYRALGRPFRHWADLGSGGGFPGLVVAIIAADLPEAPQVTLVESDIRKATFLRTVLREVGVAATVLSDRAESLPPLNADVLSARALADLSVLLGLAARHLAPEGTALFPKGATWQKEVDQARSEWQFDCDQITSLTEPSAAILKIEGIARV